MRTYTNQQQYKGKPNSICKSSGTSDDNTVVRNVIAMLKELQFPLIPVSSINNKKTVVLSDDMEYYLSVAG
jgi:hypothetical protein